jgi:hypothetical protein
VNLNHLHNESLLKADSEKELGGSFSRLSAFLFVAVKVTKNGLSSLSLEQPVKIQKGFLYDTIKYTKNIS